MHTGCARPTIVFIRILQKMIALLQRNDTIIAYYTPSSHHLYLNSNERECYYSEYVETAGAECAATKIEGTIY